MTVKPKRTKKKLAIPGQMTFDMFGGRTGDTSAPVSPNQQTSSETTRCAETNNTPVAQQTSANVVRTSNFKSRKCGDWDCSQTEISAAPYQIMSRKRRQCRGFV